MSNRKQMHDGKQFLIFNGADVPPPPVKVAKKEIGDEPQSPLLLIPFSFFVSLACGLLMIYVVIPFGNFEKEGFYKSDFVWIGVSLACGIASCPLSRGLSGKFMTIAVPLTMAMGLSSIAGRSSSEIPIQILATGLFVVFIWAHYFRGKKRYAVASIGLILGFIAQFLAVLCVAGILGDRVGMQWRWLFCITVMGTAFISTLAVTFHIAYFVMRPERLRL